MAEQPKKKPGRKKATPLETIATNCLEIPPYPTGAGPGCVLWGDGEHLHWSDPPTAPGQVLTWTGTEWVAANPPAAMAKPEADKPEEPAPEPPAVDADQPM